MAPSTSPSVPTVELENPGPSTETTDPVLSQVLKKLPKIRSRWPEEVRLTKVSRFNILDGSNVIGVVQFNAGTKIRLLEIKPQHAVVKIATGESPLPVLNTDIIEQLGGAQKILAFPDDPPVETKSSGEKSARIIPL
ncbi:hypothetical protein [Geminisphaera colitermitum]|uniref:hypothetical protein n=1 Tax=Geminisphaera colitermitum TaxID=1148786 RepID=UPI0018E2C938|nr:hypothetical protein [Geminisphaera colitermitum]